MSLTHIFKNNMEHIVPQNSFAMSHFKFILTMDLPWDNES